ncbi:hypothetical protein PSPO01_15336 [Paraphaeosphaeria sporulosa]
MDSQELQTAVSSFRLLLLSTYCAYLKKNHYTKDVIDGILNQVTSIREYDRHKLPERALHINKLIDRLVGSGWSLYRSTELFFLLAISPTYLIWLKIEDSEALFNEITSRKYLEEDFESCLSAGYSIPGLLKTHIDRVYPNNGIAYVVNVKMER